MRWWWIAVAGLTLMACNAEDACRDTCDDQYDECLERGDHPDSCAAGHLNCDQGCAPAPL